MKKRALLLIGVFILLAGILYVGLKSQQTVQLVVGATASYGTSTNFIYYSSDVVGTHIGTSTVGVAFENALATSSFISKVGGNKSTAVYTIFETVASTTNALALSVQGSNDYACDTSDTTTTGAIWQSNINWFSAGDHLVNKAQTLTLPNASTTNFLTWTNAVANEGQEVILTNLNYECLRLNVSGVSTTIYAGLRTK